MTQFSVSIDSSVTFGVATRFRRFLHRHVVGSAQDTNEACLPCLPLYPILRLASTQGHPWRMCSTAAFVGIDRNQLPAESLCFLGDIAVVSIHPIEVVASTPSQGSTSSGADPSVAGLEVIRILVISFDMPTVHPNYRLTSSALP